MSEPLERRSLFDGSLFSPEVIPVTTIPGPIETADLNGDGLPDIVTANVDRSTAQVSVLLSRGDGSFASAADYPLGAGTKSSDVSLNDVNGDGHADMIAVTGNSVLILINSGTGTFGPARVTTLATGQTALTVVSGDLDGDGKIDLVVGGYDSSSAVLGMMKGVGDGSFGAVVPIASGVRAVDVLRLVDVNANGTLDIVAGDSNSQFKVSVILNGGTSGFSTPALYTGGRYASDIVAADFTGDGKVDLALPDSQGGWVAIRLLTGSGTGTFTSATTPFHATFWNVGTIASGDVNNDGRQDLVVGGVSVGFADVFLGTANGLTPGPVEEILIGAERSSGLALSDLNGDGYLDLLTTTPDSEFRLPSEVSTVTIQLGDGTGWFVSSNFEADHITTNVTRAAHEQAQVIDVDGDGYLDVVDTGLLDSKFSIAYGQPASGFGVPQTYNASFNAFDDVNLGDVDGDGRLDAVFNGQDGQLRLMLNAGGRSFGAATIIDGPSGVPRLADVNGDSLLDITLAGQTQMTLLGNGDGTFQRLPNGPSLGVMQSGSVRGARLADLNGDDILDLAYLLSPTGDDLQVGVALGTGSGVFASPLLSAERYYFTSTFDLADIDGNGRLDFVLATLAGTKTVVSILSYSGTSFSSIGTLLLPAPGGAIPVVAVADLDGDNKIDILAGSPTSKNVLYVYTGHGDGTFEPVRIFLCGMGLPEESVVSPDAIAVADVNRDGTSDAVVFSGNKFVVIDNQNARAADVTSPAVSAFTFEVSGRAPRVRLALTESLQPNSVSLSDLVIENLSTGQSFTATGYVFGEDNRALTFNLPTTLPDGTYRFTLTAGSVADFAGNATSSPALLSNASTFVLAGDVNHDHAVNFNDLLILAQNYGRTGRSFGAGNLNYDVAGNVDFDDLLILAQRYDASTVPSLVPASRSSAPPAAKGKRPLSAALS